MRDPEFPCYGGCDICGAEDRYPCKPGCANAYPPAPTETEVDRLRAENLKLHQEITRLREHGYDVARILAHTNWLYRGYNIESRSVSQAFADILRIAAPDVYKDFYSDWDWSRIYKKWFREDDETP